jgi:2-C-methyl-D-erythritol 4-phosphate cytidylyltransferase
VTTEGQPADSDSVAAIIVAAGSATRMGSDKIWADLDGVPVLQHSLAALGVTPGVTHLVVVAPADRHEAIHLLPCPVPVTVVEGGARRQDSVANGVAAVPDAGWYLVHDGARPLVTPSLAARVLDAAGQHGAAVPATPMVDTVKRVDAAGHVVETVDRASLRAVQTPQAFRGDLLRRAHAEVTADVTDDAAMLEALGVPVATAEGDRENLKITTPADLEVARTLLRLRSHRTAVSQREA